MGKIINYLKGLFSTKPKLEERYTLNRMYQDNTVLKKFVEERQRTERKSSISFIITWGDFCADQYGMVELLRNGKIVDKAELIKGEYGLIYWRF